MASQTEGKPEWFLPGVTDQMLSEIRVIRKSWKLASPHYALKSESDEIVKKTNSGESNGSFWLMAWTPIPSLLTKQLIPGI